MSNIKNNFNGKLQTAADIENFTIKMDNVETVNKSFIKKMLYTLNSIMAIAQSKEKGICSAILKWFRLYLKLNFLIDPDDKLFKYYENTVPPAITYIIGCLQYKFKEMPNYHSDLLNIFEELLDNTKASVLKNIYKLEKGTIGCLWNTIDLAGDFNTQLKVIKILSALLQQFDEVRQNEELKCIKWTTLNLFQDKLKTIVQETKLSHLLENSSRDLLNNYNMNLSKKVLVYSFFCKSVILGNKHKFFKPLNSQKFWIDINYYPKTLSYCGRFKLDSNSKYESINVVLKIQNIILESNILQIYFNKPGDYSKCSNYLSNIADNIVQFTLADSEKQRLIQNNYVIEYFQNFNQTNTIRNNKTESNTKCTFDLLKKEVSITPDLKCEAPESSSYVKNSTEKSSVRNLRDKRKYFKSLEMEESDEEWIYKKTQRKKRKQNRKLSKKRQTKSLSKQVCKVTPTVDLTKMENMDCGNESEIQTKGSVAQLPLNKNISKSSLPLMTEQASDRILKQVADIYETIDSTYAKPCQSYRNFQKELNPIQSPSKIKNSTKSNCRKKKLHLVNEPVVQKKRKITSFSQENEENSNIKTHIVDSNSRQIVMSKSPHLFETQHSDDQLLPNEIPVISEKINADSVGNIDVDFTSDIIESPLSSIKSCYRKCTNNSNISSKESLAYEEIRGLDEDHLKDIDHIYSPTKTFLSSNSKVTTPNLTNSMHISDLNDSDMEITEISNFNNDNKIEQKVNNNSDMEIINAYNGMVKNFENDYRNTTKLQKNFNCLNNMKEVPVHLQQTLNDSDYKQDNELDLNYKTSNNNHMQRSYDRDCIIFGNRADVEESSCSDEDIDVLNFYNNSKSENQNFGIMQHMPLIFNHNIIQEKTPDKNISVMSTTCQVTPTAIVLHHVQLDAKKSIISGNGCSNNIIKNFKSSKSLNYYFADKNINNNSMEFKTKTLALQNQNTKNLNEEHLTLLPRKGQSQRETILPQKQITAGRRGTVVSELKKFSKNDCDIKILDQQQSTSSRCRLGQKSKVHSFDCNSPPVENSEILLRKDLLQIINDYTTKITLRVHNTLSSSIKNISNIYTRKFLEMRKAVLKKFEEHRTELEKIHLNIEQLLRELETQYEAFISKSKHFDIYREITEKVLESIINTDIENTITTDYEEIFQQPNMDQDEVFQKIWQILINKKNLQRK